MQASGNSNVCNLARELVFKVPVEKLDYEFLIEMQKSNHTDVRDLIWELLLRNFSDKLNYQILVEMQASGNPMSATWHGN
jgi:hypothetical protein